MEPMSRQREFWDWTKRRLAAAGHGLALAGLALSGLFLTVLALEPVAAVLTAAFSVYVHFHSGWHDGIAVIVGLVGIALAPAWTLAVLTLNRGLADRVRMLSPGWCGITIAYPYQPRAARQGRLVRPGYLACLLWLPVNGIGRLVLGAVPAALLFAGIAGFAPGRGGQFAAATNDQRLLLSAAAITVGLWAAPSLLRGYGQLSRSLLAPPSSADGTCTTVPRPGWSRWA
jgi:hypothetical protein